MTIEEINEMKADPMRWGFLSPREREIIDFLLAEVELVYSNQKGMVWTALLDVRKELLDAAEQYPDPSGLMCALTEEVGELARAMMSQPRDRIRDEAIQVAALAIRIALEGDPTLDCIRAKLNADMPLPPIPLFKS